MLKVMGYVPSELIKRLGLSDPTVGRAGLEYTLIAGKGDEGKAREILEKEGYSIAEKEK